jgi:rhamnulose-1-phosphate aldolase
VRDVGKIFEDPKLRETIDDISRVAGYLWERGWAERNAGNISADVTVYVEQDPIGLDKYPKRTLKIPYQELAGRCLLVKATGSRFRDLERDPEESILVVRIADDLEGYHILNGGDVSEKGPTSEFPSHLKIHDFMRRRLMPQRVVLHTHPSHVIALTHIEGFDSEAALNRILWAMHPEVKISLPEGVGFAPYCLPGSEDLADASLAAFQEHRIIVWEMHGCTAVGRDASEAFDLIDTVNKAAEIFFICRNAGYEPKGLSEEQIRELVEFFVDR